jgi:hypothetical protein
LEAASTYAKANFLEHDEIISQTLANFAQDVVLAMFASNAKLNADAIK